MRRAAPRSRSRRAVPTRSRYWPTLSSNRSSCQTAAASTRRRSDSSGSTTAGSTRCQRPISTSNRWAIRSSTRAATARRLGGAGAGARESICGTTLRPGARGGDISGPGISGRTRHLHASVPCRSCAVDGTAPGRPPSPWAWWWSLQQPGVAGTTRTSRAMASARTPPGSAYGDRSVVVSLTACGRDGDVVVLAGREGSTVLQAAADLGDGGADRSGVTADLGVEGIVGAFGPDVDRGPAGTISDVRAEGDRLIIEGTWVELDAALEPAAPSSTEGLTGGPPARSPADDDDTA